jgi:gliding motility-associated-like protein
MRIAWMLVSLLVSSLSLRGQCPADPLKLQGGHCVGDTLWVVGAARASHIDWYRNGQLVKTVSGGYQPSPASIVAGGNGVGYAADQFNTPICLYVDGKDTLYVADEDNWRVQQFPPGSTRFTNGTTLIQQGNPNANNGVVTSPGTGVGFITGICLDPQRNIFIEEDGVVEKWAPGAKNWVQVASVTTDLGSPGLTLGTLGPIYVDATDNVYVVEPGNNRVQKWAPGATSGVTVAGGNGAGADANQLNNPYGIYVDQIGDVYVADANNNRVQKWAAGARSGVTVAGGNGAGNAANQLNYPAGVCVDATGNVYVADVLNNRVQWWAPGATAGITVVGGNGQGSALNQLAEPTDVFLSADGYLYTSDDSNQRVVKNLPTPVYSIDTTLVAGLPGVYTAVITGPDRCMVNSLPLTVLATTAIGVGLTAMPNPVCSADSVLFTASVDTAGVAFGYKWWVNSVAVADTGAAYLYRQPAAGSVVSCTVSDTAVCVSGTSDTVSLLVNPSPVIDSGQVFSVPYGGSVTLEPRVGGDVSGYNWSPSAGLSDTAVQDPVADPRSTTVYTLRVVGTDECTATGEIKVDEYIPLRLPNAFTPNGDGKNDVFYVLGGPPGLVIREMAVFDRWGQRVFQVRDVAAGDPSVGWTGRLSGEPLPAGTYVYIVAVRLPDGSGRVVKGTVELVK